MITRVFRQFSAAVVPRREGRRTPRSGPAVQHLRWGRGQQPRRGKQLSSELSTGVLCGVDVKIGQPVFNSRDQRRLGLLKPALEGDEGRIVERRVLQTKEWGKVSPLRHSQREPGKRRD